MKKIIIFIIRINLFIFSYFLYLINLFLIYLNIKNLSKKFFIYAAYLCSISLGVSYKLNKEIRMKLTEKGIHIANHDNPLDIFIAQYIFRMPTITTVNIHLKKILPFFEISLENFGHFTFNHLNRKHRKSAYKYLKNICKKKNKVLIYPSGSIYTPIEKRFSKSISKLSIAYDLNVIAWKLDYDEKYLKNYSYKKDVLKYILNRFLSGKTEFAVKKVKIFSPRDFVSEEKYHNKLRSFYKN